MARDVDGYMFVMTMLCLNENADMRIQRAAGQQEDSKHFTRGASHSQSRTHSAPRVLHPHFSYHRRCSLSAQRWVECILDYDISLLFIDGPWANSDLQCKEIACSVGCGFEIECSPSFDTYQYSTKRQLKGCSYDVSHIRHLI